MNEWRQVHKAERAEVQSLLGRPVTSVNQQDGIYVDEEGNVYQLADKGETKPIEGENLSDTEKTELEVILEDSLKGRTANGQPRGPKRLLKKNRNSGRKQQSLQMETAKPEAEAPLALETSAPTFNVAASEDPVRFNSPAEAGRGSPPHRLRLEARPQRAPQLQLRYRRRHRRLGGRPAGRTGVVVIPRLQDGGFRLCFINAAGASWPRLNGLRWQPSDRAAATMTKDPARLCLRLRS